MALSFVVGWLFAPGANIVVLIGGLLSTLLVQPAYALRRALPKLRGRLTDVTAAVRTARSAAVDALPTRPTSTMELGGTVWCSG